MQMAIRSKPAALPNYSNTRLNKYDLQKNWLRPAGNSAYFCRQMNNVYLLLGSNEGNRLNWMQQAVEQLALKCGNIMRRSAVYQTAAWGLNEQPDFLNMVVLLQTYLPPLSLLNNIQDIEQLLGRQREVKWGQRTLDIDILLYDNQVVDLPELTIPHGFMQERRFTLVPLAELAPDLIHPLLNKPIKTLLNECTDPLEVHLFDQY
jgi:2-amino-4-hydroxy-6-hydroxymethyldihydropteridine diphosphokinase